MNRWTSLIVLIAACGSSSSAPRDGDLGAEPEAGTIGGQRPVDVHVPPTYTAGSPMPLVIMLHGYGASGALEDSYLQLTALADSRGFLYAHPDGTLDSGGKRFWNATDACCDLGQTMVDDSAYLDQLITDIGAHYTVDPKRVFFVGHSNGAFMSYRMACDHGDRIAAIVSLAGAMWSDTTKCPAATPVSILEIHGTADGTIAYTGGSIGSATYPGAVATVNDWVTFDGCATAGDTSSPPLDLETTVAGSETTVTKFAAGCLPGGHAELWTMQGAGHIPAISSQFSPDLVDFLLAHPKP